MQNQTPKNVNELASQIFTAIIALDSHLLGRPSPLDAVNRINDYLNNRFGALILESAGNPDMVQQLYGILHFLKTGEKPK